MTNKEMIEVMQAYDNGQEWMELPKYEYYDGKQWRECIVEGEL